MKGTTDGTLTAGQFAQACGVNKQTLLYYEKLGLFVPESKGETGRRCYALEQIDTFHVILALRRIMSLAELKQYTQSREKEYFLRLYDYGIGDLSAQIAHLEQRRAMMQKKLDLVREAKHIDTSIVYTQYCPAEMLKLSPRIDGPGGVGTARALGDIIQYRAEQELCLGRAIGGILPADWLECRQDPGYRYYYAELTPGTPESERFVKPEGNYMIYYYKGDYHTTCRCYPRILEHARQNRFVLGDFVYEESLIDEAVEKDPENYITKISIPFTV